MNTIPQKNLPSLLSTLAYKHISLIIHMFLNYLFDISILCLVHNDVNFSAYG